MGSAAKALAERIREIRRRHFGARGKPEFARRLGVTDEEYERYERGLVPPGELLVRICELTGEDLQWLLVGVPSRQTVIISGARSRHRELLTRLARMLDESPELAAPVEAFVDLLAEGQQVRSRVVAELPAAAGPVLVPIFAPRELPYSLPGGRPPGAGRGEEAAQNGRELAPWVADDMGLVVPEARVTITACEAARLAEPASEYDEAAARPVELVTAVADRGEPRQYLRGSQIGACFPDLFGVRIEDDEMSPMFRAGDALLVTLRARARVGRPALCRLDGPPHACCRIYLGEDEGGVQLGRLADGELERVPRDRVRWSLEVLYRVRAA